MLKELSTDHEVNVYPQSATEQLLPVYADTARTIANSHEYSSQIIDKGFDTYKQVARFQLTYIEEKQKGSSHKQAINAAMEQAKYDIDGYNQEFQLRLPMLPIHVGYDEHGLIATKYAGGRYLEYFDEIERGGYTKWGMLNLEQQILQSDVGDTLVVASPQGPSGYGHDHPDSFVMIYKKQEDGNIDALNLRTNLSLTQTENLLEMLSSEEYQALNSFDNYARIKDVVSTVIKIPGGSMFSDPKDILSAIQAQLGVGNYIWTDPDNGRQHSYENVWGIIEHRDLLHNFNDIVEKVLSEMEADFSKKFRRNVKFSNRDIEWITKRINKAVMDASFLQRNPGADVNKNRDKQAEKAVIESASGCSSPGERRTYSASDIRVLRNLGFKHYENGLTCRMCKKRKKWLGPCTICPDCDSRFK